MRIIPYVIRRAGRDELAAHLTRSGIGVVIHYPIPMHLQPVYRAMGLGRGAFPVAEAAADQVLSLPIYAEITRATGAGCRGRAGVRED